MKEFFKNLYDGLLSLFSAALEEIQNIHSWFRRQEEKAKEYKKDLKKYMETGEIDTVKYGTSKKAQFQRRWQSHKMHLHFSVAYNMDIKKKLREYGKFMEKYKDKLGFGVAKLYKKEKYRYNETEWTPIPHGYMIKKFIETGSLSPYVTYQERKNIFYLRRSGKFEYRDTLDCVKDGLRKHAIFSEVLNLFQYIRLLKSYKFSELIDLRIYHGIIQKYRQGNFELLDKESRDAFKLEFESEFQFSIDDKKNQIEKMFGKEKILGEKMK